jgi:hypothetical protein
MWTPNERDYAVLREMPSWQRLFVQRWVELTASDIGFRWRQRPLTRRLLQDEASQIVVTRAGRRSIGNSTYQAALLDEEWQDIPKTMFADWSKSKVVANPEGMARDMVHGLSLAGFSQKLVNEVRRVFLDGRNLQDQLDSVLSWHQPLTTPRKFTLVFPLARMGAIPPYVDWVRRGSEDLPESFKQVMQDARDAGHADATDNFIESRIEAVDANAAVTLFREEFDRYKLRLPHANTPIKLPTRPVVLVSDPAPTVGGRIIRFKVPSLYSYGRPAYLDGAAIGRAGRAATCDPVIDLVLDQYLSALDSVSRDSVREAFQALLPILDLAFDCGDPAYNAMGPFARTTEIGALLIAASFPRALFEYLSDYLRDRCWINSGRRGVGGGHKDVLRVLTVDRLWESALSSYSWNETLKVRRQELLSVLDSPRATLRRIHTVAKWDLSRAVRARHSLAHRGEPMSDSYLLAVALEAVRLNLAMRCGAVEEGLRLVDILRELRALVCGSEPTRLARLSVDCEDKWCLVPAIAQIRRS